MCLFGIEVGVPPSEVFKVRCGGAAAERGGNSSGRANTAVIVGDDITICLLELHVGRR